MINSPQLSPQFRYTFGEDYTLETADFKDIFRDFIPERKPVYLVKKTITASVPQCDSDQQLPYRIFSLGVIVSALSLPSMVIAMVAGSSWWTLTSSVGTSIGLVLVALSLLRGQDIDEQKTQ